MTYTNKRHTYSTRRVRRYPNPNEADPSYFVGRFLDGVTAAVSCLGVVTLLMYFLTF